MSYQLLILPRAGKELNRLPDKEYRRVSEAIRVLSEEPRPHGCKKLVDREGWRIRIGNYRVIYEIDDSTRRVTILHIGNRRDVYE